MMSRNDSSKISFCFIFCYKDKGLGVDIPLIIFDPLSNGKKGWCLVCGSRCASGHIVCSLAQKPQGVGFAFMQLTQTHAH